MDSVNAPSVLNSKTSDQPKRHHKVPGMVKRLARTSVWDRVEALGGMSDVAVVKTARREDLVRNLAFAIVQQRLWGALRRLSQVTLEPATRSHDQVACRKGNHIRLQTRGWERLPHRVELARLKSAMMAVSDE